MQHGEHNVFDAFADNHPIGTKLRGRATTVREFGAFCELAEGVEGLLMVIDFDVPRPKTFPNDYPRIGDVIDVRADFMNREARKIRLTQLWPSRSSQSATQ